MSLDSKVLIREIVCCRKTQRQTDGNKQEQKKEMQLLIFGE